MDCPDIFKIEIFGGLFNECSTEFNEEPIYVKNEISEEPEAPVFKFVVPEVCTVKMESREVCGLNDTENASNKFKVAAVNSKRFKCTNCEKDYSTKGGLTAHVNVIHHRKEIICQSCQQNFRWRSEFLLHEKNVHSDCSVSKFKCISCDKGYAQKRYLSRHITIEHNGIKVPCPNCSKEYKFYASWLKHVLKCSQNQKCSNMFVLYM
jgi:transcription elongation factor Elf1